MCIPDESAVGIKNVTHQRAVFPGPFPAQPVMPGVLIVEAMAQTAAVLVVTRSAIAEGKLVYFMSSTMPVSAARSGPAISFTSI